MFKIEKKGIEKGILRKKLCNVHIINRVVLVVVMTDAFLCFFQFLIDNMVACGRRFWWIWENENYEDEMTKGMIFHLHAFY